MEKKIQKVAVIGTGILGSQIAALSASFGYQVLTYDTDESSFHRGLQNIRSLTFFFL